MHKNKLCIGSKIIKYCDNFPQQLKFFFILSKIPTHLSNKQIWWPLSQPLCTGVIFYSNMHLRKFLRELKIILISIQMFPQQPGSPGMAPGMASLSLEVCITRVCIYNLYIGMSLITKRYDRLFLSFSSQKSVAIILSTSKEVHEIYQSLFYNSAILNSRCFKLQNIKCM